MKWLFFCITGWMDWKAYILHLGVLSKVNSGGKMFFVECEKEHIYQATHSYSQLSVGVTFKSSFYMFLIVLFLNIYIFSSNFKSMFKTFDLCVILNISNCN